MMQVCRDLNPAWTDLFTSLGIDNDMNDFKIITMYNIARYRLFKQTMGLNLWYVCV